MPQVLVNPIVREHALELRGLLDSEIEKALVIYEQARLELHERMASLPGDRFQAQQTRIAMAQVEEAIRTMVGRLHGDKKQSLQKQLGQSVQQTLKEIAFYEPSFKHAQGRIETRALKQLLQTENLLLTQYKTSVQRYGLDVIGEMQRRLSVHLVKKSTWRDISIDLAGRLKTNGFRKTRMRAERIVRTEMVNAMNRGHQVALEQSLQILPDLKRQWDAHLDARTSDICTALNGQVREIDKAFEQGGTSYGHPPAHPNCRSRLLPFRDEWLEHQPPDARSPKEERRYWQGIEREKERKAREAAAAAKVAQVKAKADAKLQADLAKDAYLTEVGVEGASGVSVSGYTRALQTFYRLEEGLDADGVAQVVALDVANLQAEGQKKALSLVDWLIPQIDDAKELFISQAAKAGTLDGALDEAGELKDLLLYQAKLLGKGKDAPKSVGGQMGGVNNAAKKAIEVHRKEIYDKLKFLEVELEAAINDGKIKPNLMSVAKSAEGQALKAASETYIKYGLKTPLSADDLATLKASSVKAPVQKAQENLHNQALAQIDDLVDQAIDSQIIDTQGFKTVVDKLGDAQGLTGKKLAAWKAEHLQSELQIVQDTLVATLSDELFTATKAVATSLNLGGEEFAKLAQIAWKVHDVNANSGVAKKLPDFDAQGYIAAIEDATQKELAQKAAAAAAKIEVPKPPAIGKTEPHIVDLLGPDLAESVLLSDSISATAAYDGLPEVVAKAIQLGDVDKLKLSEKSFLQGTIQWIEATFDKQVGLQIGDAIKAGVAATKGSSKSAVTSGKLTIKKLFGDEAHDKLKAKMASASTVDEASMIAEIADIIEDAANKSVQLGGQKFLDADDMPGIIDALDWVKDETGVDAAKLWGNVVSEAVKAGPPKSKKAPFFKKAGLFDNAHKKAPSESQVDFDVALAYVNNALKSGQQLSMEQSEILEGALQKAAAAVGKDDDWVNGVWAKFGKKFNDAHGSPATNLAFIPPPAPAPPPPPPVSTKPWPTSQSGAPSQITLPNGKTAKKVKGSAGSNPGGFYRDADGAEWFIKFPKATAQVSAEDVTAALARKMGLHTKEYVSFQDGQHVAIAGPKVSMQKTTASNLNAWHDQDALADQFVHAAWTRNWDAVGLEFDNLVVMDGKLSVIDYGGSLMWRAQGGLKQGGLPKVVEELTSLRNSGTNPQTSKVFGKLKDKHIAERVLEKLSGITDEDLVGILAKGNFAEADHVAVLEGLKARRDYLLEWAAKKLGKEVPVPGVPAMPPMGAKLQAGQTIEQALLGHLDAANPSGVLKDAAGSPITSGSMYESMQQALGGDGDRLIRMGRRLWTGTTSVQADQDLSLRMLTVAWEKSPKAVEAELNKFSTMKDVLDVLKAGYAKDAAEITQIAKAVQQIGAVRKAKEAKLAAEAAQKAAAAKAKQDAQWAQYKQELAEFEAGTRSKRPSPPLVAEKTPASFLKTQIDRERWHQEAKAAAARAGVDFDDAYKVIRSFTGGGYSSIRDAQRQVVRARKAGQVPELTGMALRAENATKMLREMPGFEHGPKSKHQWVSRKETFRADGERGLTADQVRKEFIQMLDDSVETGIPLPGWGGLTSTASNPGVWSGDLHYRIYGKVSGTPVAKISASGSGEYEVLSTGDQRLQVRRWFMEGKNLIVECHEVMVD